MLLQAMMLILGFIIGGIGKRSARNRWKRLCDALSAELIWNYKVAFNADYDQQFNYELEKFDDELAEEVKKAFNKSTFVEVVIHYTEINRLLHLACYIRLYKMSNFTDTVRILYIVAIYKFCVNKLN